MANTTARFIQGFLCLVLAPTASYGVAVSLDIYMTDEPYAVYDFNGFSSKCELKYENPGLGVGYFQGLAGEDLIFRIECLRQVVVEVNALMQVVSPSWEHNEPGLFSLSAAVIPDLAPLELDRKPAA